jgi:IS30 family transposase
MKHLTLWQRYQIEAYLKSKKKQKWIAAELKVSESTISREIQRNKSKRGKYIAKKAIEYSNERKERFGYNRTFKEAEKQLVEKYIRGEQWSPEQIAGHCKKANISMVSVERIYQHVRQDKVMGGDLHRHMRHKLKKRKRPVGENKYMIKNRISIDDRPELINNKERIGDWEIDTIIGKDGKGAILTIVERKTSFVMIRLLRDGKQADGLANELCDMLLPYKDQILSITSDNGSEFTEHQRITKKLDTDFFFAHPYASWERGLNEYTNKLIRQYIPKKTDFCMVNDSQITEIQHKLNRRPRKILGFKTPLELFNKFVNQKIAFAG